MKNFVASVSKLSAYGISGDDTKGCPRKYKFKYIDKLPSRQQDHFAIGTFTHKVLELWGNKLLLNPQSDPSLFMREAFIETQGLHEGKVCSKEQKELARDWLRKYLETWENSKIYSAEMKFNLSIDNNVSIQGVIDRIDLIDDKNITIFDYKTTKNKSFLDDFQLSTYVLALQSDIRFKDMNISAAYILLRYGGEQVKYTFSPEKIQETKDKILKTIKQIQEDTIFPLRPSKLCNYCEYNHICFAKDYWDSENNEDNSPY